MQLNKYLLLSIIFLNQVLLGGFDRNTLVQTPQGRALISRLKQDDLVMCRKGDQLLECRVRNQHAKLHKAAWCVELSNEVIKASAEQRFYAVKSKTWKRAQDLEPGEMLLTIHNEQVIVQRAYETNEEIEWNEIEVDDCHNYFASKTGVLVHNEPFSIVVGVTFAFGSGAAEAMCITGGLAVLGGALGLKMASDANNNRTIEPIVNIDKLNEELAVIKGGTSTKEASKVSEKAASEKDKKDEKGNGGEKDPKKDDKNGEKKDGTLVPPPVTSDSEKDKTSAAGSGSTVKGSAAKVKDATPDQSNGKYNDAAYHHTNSKGGSDKGGKSPGPKDGQKALDNSIQVSDNSPRRVAASDGEFVILDKTSEGVYHGHVRQWNQLENDMKAVLRRENLVNKKGKIL